MARTKTYPLEEGGPDRVELSWTGNFKDVVVELDGQQVNAEPFSRQEIEAGQRLRLPDGSHLTVRRQRSFFANELQVSWDGKALPGSGHHPASRAKTAAIVLWVVAGLTLIAVVAVYFGEDFLDWISLSAAAVYAVLGFLVFRQSLVALWIGVVLYSLETAFWIFASISTGEFPILFTLIRVGLIVLMARALPALRELKAQQAESIIS